MDVVLGMIKWEDVHGKFVQTLYLTNLLGCVRIVLLGKYFIERGVYAIKRFRFNGECGTWAGY
jgi:hypothetical protein